MSRTIARVMALPCAFVLILASADVDAQNIFRKSTSTENGYNTWNDDAIDIENVYIIIKGMPQAARTIISGEKTPKPIEQPIK